MPYLGLSFSCSRRCRQATKSVSSHPAAAGGHGGADRRITGWTRSQEGHVVAGDGVGEAVVGATGGAESSQEVRHGAEHQECAGETDVGTSATGELIWSKFPSKTLIFFYKFSETFVR